MAPLHRQFLVFSTLIMLLNVQLTLATSKIATIAKDQISCTMCSSCDNPCQPIFSPPPPPSSDYNFPAPPPSSDYNFPPSQYCPGGCSQQPPSPPYNGGGGVGGVGDGDYYYPPTDPSVYPIPPPPNPIVSYYPFYYHNPPSPYTVVDSKSAQLKNHPFITCLILVLPIFLFL